MQRALSWLSKSLLRMKKFFASRRTAIQMICPFGLSPRAQQLPFDGWKNLLDGGDKGDIRQ